MNLHISWLILYSTCCLLCLTAADSRYNITFSQLDTCKDYSISDSSYVYKDFFTVRNLDNNNIKGNQRMHLKFYVLANMDAHILLSVTNSPRANDRVYEIVIGAGGNTFSAIRTRMGAHRVSTNQDPHLLSVYEPTPIEIIQTRDGELFVYIPGFKSEPLLNYTDLAPLSIGYISFSTFGTNSARWFYDCSFDGFDSEIEQEELKQSVGEKLLDSLIFQGQNSSLPANLSSIQFRFQMRSLSYDQSSALLKTRMELVMNWQDERLSWEPAQYGQLATFEHPDLQLWIPQITVINGALDSLGSALKAYELRVSANGNVTLLAHNLELTSWCVDTARNWPNERISCDIELGILENRRSIALIYDQPEQRPLAPKEHVNTPSAWTFVEIAVVQVENDVSRRYTPKGMLQTRTGDVAIEFVLQRNNRFYRLVFTMPLMACQILIVLSFILRSTRGALLLIVLLITAWSLMYLTRFASPHYVPPLSKVF